MEFYEEVRLPTDFIDQQEQEIKNLIEMLPEDIKAQVKKARQEQLMYASST